MNKPKNHYSWWRYIKEIIWLYPERMSKPLPGVACLERDAVTSAIASTEHLKNGVDRMKIIKMVHWDRTHTLEGAAMEIPCDRATAARWQRKFFEDVARNRGLLD